MPLQLLEAHDADAPRIAVVERAAYAANPFNIVLFPGPFPADALERRAAGLVEARQGDPTTRWLKVVDTEIPGDEGLIAFACWHIYNPKPPPNPTPGGMAITSANLEACRRVFGGLDKIREEAVGGKDYVCECQFFFGRQG